MNELVKIASFNAKLALKQTFEEISLFESEVDAIAGFAKKEKINLNTQNEIGRLRIEIQAKKGEWLNDNFPHGA